MAITIERRAPKIRCYKCGASSVRALCHHCWRPGCGRHVVRSPAWTDWLFGVEGTGPGLKGLRGWHCGDCTQVPRRIWIGTGVSGLALVIAGLLAMTVNPVVGASLAGIGAVTTLAVYTRARRRLGQARVSLPVALHPKVSQVQAFELLRTRISLSDHGEYQTQLDPVQGKLSATLTFGDSDRDRVKAYRHSRRMTSARKVPWSAGQLVLQGWVGINELCASQVLEVKGEDAADILELGREDSPASRRWNIAQDYTLSIAPDIKAGPFWITPSIGPGSEKHVLEIDVQWTEFGPEDGAALILDMIDLLRIRVPVGWGRIKENSRGAATLSSPEEEAGGEWSRVIEWKQLSPSRPEREARQFTITVRFENQILAENDLSGRLQATMRGALSGVSGIRTYNALGQYRNVSGPPTVKTSVVTDFTLSMASVRYQATRVFPDRADEDMNHGRFSDDFDVIPDDGTIISLTNALAENNFYVKRVTENPPRSGGRADVLHRYWHIAGRSYEGVHAVDFHFVVTGEEIHRGDVRPDSGNTKIRISVSGDYTNQGMRARVDNTWESLRVVTNEAVMKARNSSGHGPTID